MKLPETRQRILLVEDSEDDALLISGLLKPSGFEIARRVDTETSLREALAEGAWDAIISDYVIPGFSGLEALRVCKERNLDIPFIIVSGGIGEEIAVEAMRLGAHDYVLKDRLARLPAALDRELRDAGSRRMKRLAEEERDRQRGELAAKAEQLYRSNQDLERFAYIAAHDLQEPLRMVKAYSQMLIQRLRRGDHGDLPLIVDTIGQGVDRMHQLIEGLLSYSRVVHDADQNLTAFDGGDLVRELLMVCGPSIEEARAEVTWDPFPRLVADRTQVLQILQNLLSNAVKYRRSGAAPHIHLKTQRVDEEWIFSVLDDGIGIDPKYHRRIFQIFKRLHRDEYPGTGVGLALAKRLVDLHGGRIWVDSAYGNGATFYFTLPVRAEPEARRASC